MTIEELFKSAPNGAFTLQEFLDAAKTAKAKFVDLSGGEYVSKQKYTDDLAARDTRISTLDDTIKSRDTDLSNLRQQLDAAGNDTAKLAKLNNQFSALQTKYNTDMENYKNQLAEQEYRHAVNDFAGQQRFTSQAAKRDFVNSMLAKKLSVENGVIVGANDFKDAYAKENDDAFLKEKSDGGKPHFVDHTGNGAGGTDDNPFSFNFVGIRNHETK